MTHVDLNLLLKERKDRYYNNYIKTYLKLMERANDKEFALQEFTKRMEGRSKFIIEIDDYKKDLIIAFDRNFKLGRSIDKTLKDIENIRKRGKYLGNITISDEEGNVISESNGRYDKRFFNNKDEKTVVEFFAKHIATNEVVKFLESEKQEIQKREPEKKGKNYEVKTVFKLSEKKGAKIDLIRILNALYELRLIGNTNGNYPTKEGFMKKAGEFFGVDLQKYDVNLSQTFNGTLEANLKVFKEMEKKCTDEWTKRNK